MDVAKKCGCKGIRTCLICEKDGNLTRNDDDGIKETVQYQFCYCCGLCWPVGDIAEGPPLFLSHLTLIPEFVTSEEEEELRVAIDSIEWMPSQSGRKKQDFGPKVNFKKKKSKIGNFNGFPSFAKPIIKRFSQCDDLSDFRPVELCHLDYDPARGSAIEPHIDDTWIWGERLVTLNLESPTVLTLTPANKEGSCDCQTHCLNVCSSSMEENGHSLNVSTSFVDEGIHCLNVSASSMDENDHSRNVSASSVEENGQNLNNVSASSMDENDHSRNVSASSMEENGRCLNVSATSVEENGQNLNVSASSMDGNGRCLNMSASSVDENNHCLSLSESSMEEDNHRLNVSESSMDENHHCLKVSVSSLDETNDRLNSSSMDENGQRHCHTDVSCTTIGHFTSVTSDVIGHHGSSNGIRRNNVIESLGCLSKSHASLSKADSVKMNDELSSTICKSNLSHVNHHNVTPGEGDCIMTESGRCNPNDPLHCHTKYFKAVDANRRNINNLSLQTAFDKTSLDTKNLHSAENIVQKNMFPKNTPRNPKKLPNCVHSTFLNRKKSAIVENMCNVHRIGKERPNIEVLVPLPARSLVVLAGCSRHNWFHEIRRKDIVSRRLAMTFRELAKDFMPGGSEENIGSQLLELGHTFWEDNRVASS